MQDQVDSLTRRGIAATFINSSLTVAEQNKRLDAFASNRYKILLVAPERLRSTAFREALNRASLSLLTIDEAHCLSQWGHDFRPDYLHIGDMRREFQPPVTLALTATATLRVQDDILKLLGMGQAKKLVTGFNRPNVYLEVLNAPDVKTKLALTRVYLAKMRDQLSWRDASSDGSSAYAGAGIIYTGTRRDTEEVADFVRERLQNSSGLLPCRAWTTKPATACRIPFWRATCPSSSPLTPLVWALIVPMFASSCTTACPALLKRTIRKRVVPGAMAYPRCDFALLPQRHGSSNLLH